MIKKIITLFLAVCLMTAGFTIVTPAADIEGMWDVLRSPGTYNVEEDQIVIPAPGYMYTEDGFTTVSPDYTNYTPYYTVQTKDAHNLKDGLYLQIRIDDFPYGGETGMTDHWISFNLSDKWNIAVGGVEYGNNWFSLIRGDGAGTASVESYSTTQTTEEKAGRTQIHAHTTFSVPVDEEGREIYTFKVTWDGSNYVLTINDIVVSNADLSKALKTFVESGDYYVGVTMHCGEKDASSSITVLKYGTSQEDATTPMGSDSREPEENRMVYGDLIDPSTVPENTPALMFDASMIEKDPAGDNMTLYAMGDNSYHITAFGATPYFNWSIKPAITYSITDFPVFAMVLKNYYGGTGTLYYCAGDVLIPGNMYMTEWDILDKNSMILGENDEYSLIIVDLSALLDEELLANDGRINALRPGFVIDDLEDPELTEWDVCYMGMFRSVEEAQQYAADRLEVSLDARPNDTDAPETQAPGINDSETNDPEASASESNDPTAKDPVETDNSSGNKGCTSMVSFGTVAIMVAATAFVVLKKKE